MKSIQLAPGHLLIVKQILDHFKVSASVFGSRAKNQAKEFSDLDICLMESYDKTTIRKVQDAFEDSQLPMKVDVVVWSELTDDFKKKIAVDLVSL